MIELLDDDMSVSVCLISNGKVLYQAPIPPLNDPDAWLLLMNGTRTRWAMEQGLPITKERP